MEKQTGDGTLSNTGKTRVEWWRKRKEEPRRVRHKVSYQMVAKRRQKASARPKSQRYASGLSILFNAKHLEKMLKRVAKKAEREAKADCDQLLFIGAPRDRYISDFVAKRLNQAKARIKL